MSVSERMRVQMYLSRPGSCVDPEKVIKEGLFRLPNGCDFMNGGQHDCQEALLCFLNGLHEDMVRRQGSSWRMMKFNRGASCSNLRCFAPPQRLLVSGGPLQMNHEL